MSSQPQPDADDSERVLGTLEVPRWLEEHPELQRRGIKLTHPLKPRHVFRTQFFEAPAFAVKILEDGSEEAAIYERFQRNPVPQSHTVPFELIGGKRPLLVMPCLTDLDSLPYHEWSLSGLLGAFLQVVEGVKYLHAQNIAHLDLCFGNVVTANEWEARAHSNVTVGRLYIIDYGNSRQLDAGPGVHPAITLPSAQVPTPHGITRLDPYSWDVYCLGKTFHVMVHMKYAHSPSPPWIVRWIRRWLLGNEKGCTSVCRCRPTARRAYWVISAIRWVSYAVESVGRNIGRAFQGSTPTRVRME